MNDNGERPDIMIHVIKTLTGVNIASQPDRIVEEAETNSKIHYPNLIEVDEIIDIYKLPKDVSKIILNTFVTMWGRTKKDQVPGSYFRGTPVLLEENFKKNIKHVIGADSPFFGKMLYLYLGGGYDKARINFTTWF